MFAGASISKKDIDTQPIKSGTITDLDEEGEKNEDSQPIKTPEPQPIQVIL